MDTLEIVGASIALGLALDQIVNARTKVRFRQRVLSIGRDLQPASGIQKLIDRFAGERLISIRAFFASSALTFCSIFFMIVLVFALDGSSAIDIILPVIMNRGSLAIQMSILVLIILLIADFISFSQTRLFMRTVNILQEKYSTVALVVGDIVSSITIYIIFMAMARLVCYVVLAYQFTPAQKVSREIIIPRVVSDIYNYSINNRSDRSVKAPDRIKLLKDKMSEKTTQDVEKNIRLGSLGGNVYKQSIQFKLNSECLSYDKSNPVASYQLITAMYSSISYGVYAAQESNGQTPVTYQPEQAQVIAASSILALAGKRNRCDIRGLEIKTTVDPVLLLKEVSLTDAYIASLSMTMEETLRAVTSKFSAYDAIVPQNDIYAFFGRAVSSDNNSFLGANGGDRNIGYKSEIFIRKALPIMKADKFYLSIPNTTYSASSMITSFLFIVFLSLKLLSEIWGYLFNSISILYNNFVLKKYVFTYSMAIILLIYYFVLGGGHLLAYAWRILLTV